MCSRLSDTTFTFGKSCSADAASSSNYQPSTNKPNDTEAFSASSAAQSLQKSANATVPTIQSSLSDQSIPIKSQMAFDEPDTFAACKSITITTTSDAPDERPAADEPAPMRVSVDESEPQLQQPQPDDVAAAALETTPKMPMAASPPTITVVCAPCTDELILESAARQQAEQIECDEDTITAASGDSVPCIDEASTDVELAPASPKATPPPQFSLEVRKCSEPNVVPDDMSPNMDEYQGECGETAHDRPIERSVDTAAALHFSLIGPSPECCPTGDDYQYDAVAVGCVAPAPTPALITTAPLGKCLWPA